MKIAQSLFVGDWASIVYININLFHINLFQLKLNPDKNNLILQLWVINPSPLARHVPPPLYQHLIRADPLGT